MLVCRCLCGLCAFFGEICVRVVVVLQQQPTRGQRPENLRLSIVPVSEDLQESVVEEPISRIHSAFAHFLAE